MANELTGHTQFPDEGIESLLRHTLDSATDAFFILDADWRFVYINEAARRMMATSLQSPDVLGKSLWDMAPQMIGGETEREYRRAMRDQASVHLERYFAEADRWYEVHAYPTPEALAIYFRDITSRKRAENDLRASELLFRQVAENIRKVFYVMSPEGEVTYVSPAFTEVWGRGVNPATVMETVVPQDRDILTNARAKVLRGEPTEITFRILRPNGELRWILDRSFPVHDEDGELARTVGIAEDITQDKQRERRQEFLAEASALLSGTLDLNETLRRLTRLAVPRIADWCAVYFADGDGKLSTVEVAHSEPAKVTLAHELQRKYPPNPEETTGAYGVYRSGEPEYVREITDEMLVAALGDDAEKLQTYRALGLRSVMTVPLVARGEKLGAMIFISAESRHLYEPADVLFAQDLATRAAVAAQNALLFERAQRAAAEAMRREKEEAALRMATEAVAATFSVEDVLDQIARSALEATNADGSFVERVSPDHEYVTVVAVAGEMTPQLGEKIPFKGSIAEYVLEKKQAEVIHALGQSLHPLPGTLQQTQANGSAVAVPLIDAGEAIGALILLRSESSETFTADEAARAHTFGNLASLAFRKVHLLEASETRSRELEEAIESRTRLMRGFSHDLKNPIGAADGHAALLEDGMLGELNEPQMKSVVRIRAALKNAVSLINDLVELARAESGQIVIKQQPVDVREIVRELVASYRPAAEQAGLSIQRTLGKVPIVSTDADRVRQILGNLLSNAVKYTPAGGQIDVRTGTSTSGGPDERDYVTIEVADTGIGIPQDKVESLFTEFERIDPTVKPGAGLGLAISRRIARLLGGDVTVTTERGAGSTFTLLVPGGGEV